MAKHSCEAGSGQNRSVHSARDTAESTVVWMDEPEEHDYPAAAAYLSLLSPVLFVRGSLTEGRPAVIADGYHRVCASYHTNANTPVRVRIVDLSPAARS